MSKKIKIKPELAEDTQDVFDNVQSTLLDSDHCNDGDDGIELVQTIRIESGPKDDSRGKGTKQ